MPSIITKLCCNYITNRFAQIRVGGVRGPKFPVKSGVPQGGILSPTLFIFYTHDMPPPGPNAMDICFADDVTQIIENKRNDRTQLARDTETEIKRINDYERRWKITTNMTKFTILTISSSVQFPPPVILTLSNYLFHSR